MGNIFKNKQGFSLLELLMTLGLLAVVTTPIFVSMNTVAKVKQYNWHRTKAYYFAANFLEEGISQYQQKEGDFLLKKQDPENNFIGYLAINPTNNYTFNQGVVNVKWQYQSSTQNIKLTKLWKR